MNASPSALARRTLRTIVALLPWVFALYLHYWLENDGGWRVDMPYRGLISVALLASGMALSLVVHTRLTKRAP